MSNAQSFFKSKILKKYHIIRKNFVQTYPPPPNKRWLYHFSHVRTCPKLIIANNLQEQIANMTIVIQIIVNYFLFFIKNKVFPKSFVESLSFEPLNRNESGRFGALKSDSTHHFFRNACTKSGSLRFSQFSGCWLILSVYILMSFDFPFVRLFGVR